VSGGTTVRAVSGETPWLVTLRDELGHEWLADEPSANGGGERGPTPHQLLLSSLGACTVMTLRMYAARKGWELRAVEVELRFNPHGPPPDGGSLIERRIALAGTLDDEQRTRLLELANKCPIHRMLTGEVHVASSLRAQP
jgi:putative redox protein